MQDMVPLGSGNSRTLKSNIAADTTLAQLIAMLRAGTLPVDIGAVNPAGVAQQGTPLSKSTLLADTTAAALAAYTGQTLPGEPTINDVLAAISTLPVGARVEIGSYQGNNNYGSANPNVLTCSFEPKLLIVVGQSYDGLGVMICGKSRGASIKSGSTNLSYLMTTWTDNTVSWYSSMNDQQLNRGGPYAYIFIG